jgi:excinuclease UvrABC nuclease subunit
MPELLRLPRVGFNARRPGVYFLFRGTANDLVYIGSARNVRTRVSKHGWDQRAIAEEDESRRFHNATYLPVDAPWYVAVELAYIDRYKPRLNSRVLNAEKVYR